MVKESFFQMPPIRQNYEGRDRKVGFEMEFSGVELKTAARLVSEIFGGDVKSVSRFHYTVEGTKYGDFTIELDAVLLKDERYSGYLKKVGVDVDRLEIREEVEKALNKMASAVVPHEIVLPPIPMGEIEIVEQLKESLRENRAVGTRSSFVYAFSLQINPEIPSASAESITSYIKAFLLLYHWIFKRSQIDLTRRLAPFINDFPSSYYQIVLKENYEPDLSTLIDDYLLYNPTRNRPLDLLPLFSHLDKERVWREGVEKELIKPRPTFHYRLPNSLIDEPDWSIAREWNLWVQVEKLAGDREKLRKMSQDFLDTVSFPMSFFTSRWSEKVERWVGES